MSNRVRKITVVVALAFSSLTLVACGPAYEGTVSISEKDESTMYVTSGKVKTLRPTYKLKLCPETAASTSEDESMDCFWEHVTRNEFNDATVGEVVNYAERGIQ